MFKNLSFCELELHVTLHSVLKTESTEQCIANEIPMSYICCSELNNQLQQGED